MKIFIHVIVHCRNGNRLGIGPVVGGEANLDRVGGYLVRLVNEHGGNRAGDGPGIEGDRIYRIKPIL